MTNIDPLIRRRSFIYCEVCSWQVLRHERQLQWTCIMPNWLWIVFQPAHCYWNCTTDRNGLFCLIYRSINTNCFADESPVSIRIRFYWMFPLVQSCVFHCVLFVLQFDVAPFFSLDGHHWIEENNRGESAAGIRLNLSWLINKQSLAPITRAKSTQLHEATEKCSFVIIHQPWVNHRRVWMPEKLIHSS